MAAFYFCRACRLSFPSKWFSEHECNKAYLKLTDTITHKQCLTCNILVDRNKFQKSAASSDGLISKCKDCQHNAIRRGAYNIYSGGSRDYPDWIYKVKSTKDIANYFKPPKLKLF